MTMTVKEMVKKLTKETIDPLSEVVFENKLGIFEWDISVNCIADRVLIIKLKKVELILPKNKLTDQEEAQLENSFTYHSPKDDQPERYVEIRNAAKNLARTILECAPSSRERSIAITQIELGVAMANKAIACNE